MPEELLPHEGALLRVTSCRAVLQELGIQRPDDGSRPSATEVLPSYPATPPPELRVDRSRCASDLFRMVHEQQGGAAIAAAAAASGGANNPPIKRLPTDSKQGTPRPGVVCVVASSGAGKTFLMQQMLADVGACISAKDAAVADPTFLDWLGGAVVMAVNFNSYFRISEIEAELVEDEVLTFEDLVRVRLVFCERADLERCGKSGFYNHIRCLNFALRRGVLTSAMLREDATDLMVKRGGRGAPDDALIILVDEVAIIGKTKGGAAVPLRRYLYKNAALYEDEDGVIPSVVALLVSACCRVADEGGGSVLSSATESRLVQEGATVLSRRKAPHYNGLIEDPEGCVPLCLDALKGLARRGLYLYSREVDSTELAEVLRRDLQGGRGDLSERGVVLLTPIARSLAYATGGHVRTAVELYCRVVDSEDGEDVAAMLNDFISEEFELALTDVWDAASMEDRNIFLAKLILQDAVFYSAVAFPSLVGKLPGTARPVWDYVRRRGLVFGSGSPFVGRLSPLMLRQILARESSDELAFKACLDAQVDRSAAPSWMLWESVCCYREWAHSIARSMYPKRFSAVSIGDLFGKGSLYCGGGDLLTTVRVNASVPRTGVGQHNLQTLLSWEGTDKEVNLENRVWLLTEKIYGVDALAFFRCVKCDHMPELESKLIAVGIQNKFKNLVGDAEKQKQNLFSADVVYKSWSLLPNGQSFGRYWSDWKERFVYWGVAYLDAQVKFDMNKKADTNRMCADNSIVTTKEQLAFALDSTTFHNTMAPGALLKCVVQHF